MVCGIKIQISITWSFDALQFITISWTVTQTLQGSNPQPLCPTKKEGWGGGSNGQGCDG